MTVLGWFFGVFGVFLAVFDSFGVIFCGFVFMMDFSQVFLQPLSA